MSRRLLPIVAAGLAALALVALPAAALCGSCCAMAPAGMAAPGCCGCDGAFARPAATAEAVVAGAGSDASSSAVCLVELGPAFSGLLEAPALRPPPTGAPPPLGSLVPSPRRL
jgi:hypothetical protein